MERLEILFEDEFFVAVNKPEAVMVHRSEINNDRRFVMQMLRDQIDCHVYTVHRLDRATSGVLVYGKSSEAAGALAAQFREKTVEKKYLAVVRGWTPESGVIDYALRDQDKPNAEYQESLTRYVTLAQSEAPMAIGNRYPTARFSLVSAMPETGRRHQIRKHFAHILHPVIGDKRHGDNKHNNYFWNVLEIPRMLLHARSLRFLHPFTQEPVALQADWDDLFEKALTLLALKSWTSA